jgi:hypothetical protein
MTEQGTEPVHCKLGLGLAAEDVLHYPNRRKLNHRANQHHLKVEHMPITMTRTAVNA